MKFVKTILNKIEQWKTDQETRKDLSRLSDRELDDIGISRHDIKFIKQRCG